MKQLSMAVLVALTMAFTTTSYAEKVNYTSAGASSAAESKSSDPKAAQAAYDSAKSVAVAAVNKAKKVGGEWRDIRWKKSKAVKIKANGKTKKMSYLAAADAYAAMGDFKKAMKYIGIVQFQGEMGYEQAMEQKSAGPRL